MLIFLIIIMTMVIYYFISSRNLEDKILSSNIFSAQTIVFAILWSWEYNNSYGIDVGLLYASTGFLSAVAFLDFFESSGGN